MNEPQMTSREVLAPIRVLVVEDDPEMLDLIRRVLEEEGYELTCLQDGRQAQPLIEAGELDILLTDVRMPGVSGMDLLHQAMAHRLEQPVILMTAFGSIASAVEAMRDGAFHYLAKPFNLDELLEVMASAATQIRQLRAIRADLEDRADPFFPIVFRSPAMARLLGLAREVAASQATVLIQGASGTGKELLARAIHGMSDRRRGPFVPVDANAIPETLIESELFGHRRGAFTGAVEDRAGIIQQADGGTLFLDEVGNLSPAVQGKLLRFCQERRYRRVGEAAERSVDLRLVSASNRPLAGMVASNELREDLFYRLSVITLDISALAERREDIAPLVYHFIRRFNDQGPYRVEGIRREALEALVDFSWPGNVRQLENVLERAVILRKAGLIQLADLPASISGSAGSTSGLTLEEMERQHILDLLSQCDGNQSRVARILGISRRTVYRKLKGWGMLEDGTEPPGEPSRRNGSGGVGTNGAGPGVAPRS